jgi:hypothetical protein
MNNAAGKRKVLFITPDYMDYTSIILDGITEYSNAETFLITTTGKKLKFAYRNTFHRIQNFFSKLILNRNQKKVFYNKVIKERLETIFKELQGFDDIFILRPDLIKEHLPFIRKHGKRLIAYFWDSFARELGGRETIKYFDKFFSFEPKNVKEHNLLFLSNFYPPDLEINKDIQPQFDLSYVASADDRLATLERILDSLHHLDLKTNINILATKTILPKNKHEKNITWFTDVLPRKETIRIMNDSSVLLDIAQPKQEGLSFRIFEALVLEKKLITTNRSVATYDFYNPNNIFIWQNEGTIPAKEFFTTPYSPVSKEIVKKYSLKNWVQQIFE